MLQRILRPPVWCPRFAKKVSNLSIFAFCNGCSCRHYPSLDLSPAPVANRPCFLLSFALVEKSLCAPVLSWMAAKSGPPPLVTSHRTLNCGHASFAPCIGPAHEGKKVSAPPVGQCSFGLSYWKCLNCGDLRCYGPSVAALHHPMNSLLPPRHSNRSINRASRTSSLICLRASIHSRDRIP